jgi:hypothetical protein
LRIVGAIAVIHVEVAGTTATEIIRITVLKGEPNATWIGLGFANVSSSAWVIALDPGNVVAVLSAVIDSGEGRCGEGGQKGERGDGEAQLGWVLFSVNDRGWEMVMETWLGTGLWELGKIWVFGLECAVGLLLEFVGDGFDGGPALIYSWALDKHNSIARSNMGIEMVLSSC